MRRLLMYLSQAGWARRLVMRLRFARRASHRFVAGETLDEAMSAIRALNSAGMLATLDLLGEQTQDLAAADQATQQIIHVLEQAADSDLQTSVSIKLTQIGLNLDEKICEQNLRLIVHTAQKLGLFVRIDMEDSPCVDGTLRLYRKMRAEDYENLGVVIQSYLYRSESDVHALLQQSACIRVVKGAYMEPREIAFPGKSEVNESFDRITDLMLHASFTVPARTDGAKAWPPLAAIASHDPARIEFAKHHAAELALPKQKLEFQMLYGIRRDLQRQLVAEGYAVRIYVPFGREWYPYFVRRLAERPANLWFFLSNLLRK